MSTLSPYGFDTSCRDDYEAGRTVEGAELVAEAIYRRITTRRGTVRDAPNDGIDVRDLLQADLTDGELATVPGQLRAEIEKDDRVAPGSLRFELDRSEADQTFRLTIRGRTSIGSGFRLVMSVGELVAGGGVALLEAS